MTAFIDLQGEVLSEVPGADVILIERSIKRAARMFCEKTEVLRVTTSPAIDLVANTSEYTLPAVTNREIVRVVRGGMKWGTDVFPVHKSEDQLDRETFDIDRVYLPEDSESLAIIGGISRHWRTEVGSPPLFFYQPRPNIVRLVPMPNIDAPAQLEVTYCLKPALSSTEVDTFVVEQWYETLVKGAISELLFIRQKPWTDLKLGVHYQDGFEAGYNKVINERVSGFADNDYAVGRVKAWT